MLDRAGRWHFVSGASTPIAQYVQSMTIFTELHRQLGLQPGPLTEEMVDAAVDQKLTESGTLDWKARLPEAKNLSQHDYVKDVAAMANSGGGVIVFGVEEVDKAADRRVDVGPLSESHERSLQSVAVTAISPPVFGLEIVQVGTDTRTVLVVVPASVDGPHLMYRNEYFGAPMRNGPDTVWMKERQIETAYRARFDEQRRSHEAIDSLYAEAAAGRDSHERAWLVAVGRPRVPGMSSRLTRDEASHVINQASHLAADYCSSPGVSPLNAVNVWNPRPGLRRWVFPYADRGTTPWNEAWVGLLRDGSVTVAAAVGGHPGGSSTRVHSGSEVRSSAIEAVVADFAALTRSYGEATGHGEYDISIGIEWSGSGPFIILTFDRFDQEYTAASTPLVKYSRVEATLEVSAPADAFHRQVHELAEDCINQGGITVLRVIKPFAD